MDLEDAEEDYLSTGNTTSGVETTDYDNSSEATESDAGTADVQYSRLNTVKDYHKLRWQRLSRSYNDQYLDLFRMSQQTQEVDEQLLTSQIGSVVWTTVEKQQFFDALPRKGRHDVSAIAAAIGTKSEVEVTQLLFLLKDVSDGRQRFSMYTKNITHAEIDAAVEVDRDLESLLEDNADALMAFQDYFDHSAAENKGHGMWLIDNRAAAHVESRCEAKEEADPEGDLEVAFTSQRGKNDALGMFRVSTMLELSKIVFMNTALHHDLDHWSEVAEDDEEPSLTVDAVQTYYNTVKSFVQRLMQSAISLAESRIRSTTTPSYAPARALKDIDVLAALNVLNLPVDSFEHWASFPRRSGVRVVLGTHAKGESDVEALSLQQVEDTLSIRASRGRRRSLSSMVSMSSKAENAADVRSSKAARATPDRLPLGDMLRDSASSGEDPSNPAFDSSNDSSSEEDSNMEREESERKIVEERDVHVSRKRRRLMLEEAEDDFLEKLDGTVRTRESVRLRQLLGFPEASEESADETGTHPRTTRKTVTELQDWSGIPYRSSWEKKRSAKEAFLHESNL